GPGAGAPQRVFDRARPDTAAIAPASVPAETRSRETRRMRAKYRRFSCTVRSPYTEGAWVTYPTCARSDREPASSPSTCTVPPASRCTPTIARISVVLPDPLGPSSAVTVCFGTSNDSSGSTPLPPRTTRSSRTSIAGAEVVPRTGDTRPPTTMTDNVTPGHWHGCFDRRGEGDERPRFQALSVAGQDLNLRPPG